MLVPAEPPPGNPISITGHDGGCAAKAALKTLGPSCDGRQFQLARHHGQGGSSRHQEEYLGRPWLSLTHFLLAFCAAFALAVHRIFLANHEGFNPAGHANTKIFMPNATRNTSMLPATKNISLEAEGASMPIHIVQMGPPRTATTLQFQSTCLSLFLKLENRTIPGDDQHSLAQRMICKFAGFINHHLFKKRTPVVVKAHIQHHPNHYKRIDDSIKTKTWVFTTARTKKEASQIKSQMERAGFRNVMLVQDLETVTDRGHHIVRDYANVFNLDSRQENELLEYMRYWDILRICCGKQMSKKWRMEQWPEGTEGKGLVDIHDPLYPACSIYNITEVERLLMSTPLYQRITQANLGNMAKPSLVDQQLDGTYCLRYNELVRTEGIGFNQGEVSKLSNSTGGL